MSDDAAGFVYVWRYEVSAAREEEFERRYGPDGDWARFFAGSPAYLGTELLRETGGGAYVTIDRWRDEAAHAAFVASRRAEFDELDRRGERLSRREQLLGRFDVVA